MAFYQESLRRSLITVILTAVISGLSIVLEPSTSVVPAGQEAIVVFNITIGNEMIQTCNVDYGNYDNDNGSASDPNLDEFDVVHHWITNHTYNSSGDYVVTVMCYDREENSSEVFTTTISVIELVSNLTQESSGTIQERTLEFTYESGSHLNVTYQIDDEIPDNRRASIDENGKRINITFLHEDFPRFGYLLVWVKVFNRLSEASITVPVVNDEEIKDLHVEGQHVILVNDNALMKATVQRGSTLTFFWTIAGINSEYSQMDMCDGTERNSTVSQQFGTAGLTVVVRLYVYNSIGSVNDSRTITIVQPVVDFVASTTSKFPSSSLVLRTSSTGASLMGNLSIVVKDDQQTYLNASYFEFTQDVPVTVMDNLIQGDRSLVIRIYSDVSKQIIFFDISLWDPINIGINMNCCVTAVDKPFNIELTNSSGWGFNYEVHFGDGHVMKNSTGDPGDYQTFNYVIEYGGYGTEGVYGIRLTASNGHHGVFCDSEEIHALLPVPKFTIQPTPHKIQVQRGEYNFTVLIPTNRSRLNVTCILRFNDTLINSFPWEEVSSGILSVYFNVSDVVNISLSCENLLDRFTQSRVINVETFSVKDLEFSHSSLVNMTRRQTAVLVNFQVNLRDGSFIPPDVRFQWKFGDKSPIEENLASWNKSHSYSEKGLYNASVTIISDKEPERTVSLPMNIGTVSVNMSLTLGNANCSVFGFSISGAYGLDVQCAIHYGDGDTESYSRYDVEDGYSKLMSKIYETEGVYRPWVNVSGDLIVEEIILHPITVLWPVNGLQLLLQQEVPFPPGVGSGRITIAEDLPLPKEVSCEIDYNDQSEPDIFSVNFTDSGQHDFHHKYVPRGRVMNVTASAICSNPVSYQIFENRTTVESLCFGAERPFVNMTSPLKSFVADALTIAAYIEVVCPNMTSRYLWNITSADGSSHPITQPESTVLELEPRAFLPGIYMVNFFSDLEELPGVSISDNITVEYLRPPLSVEILGVARRTIGEYHTVALNAGSKSYDPDVGFGMPHQGLNFSWTCLETNTSDETVGLYRPCPECATGEVFDDGQLEVNDQLCLKVNKSYTFTVQVTKDKRQGEASQTIDVVMGDPPIPVIRCVLNCRLKQNADSSINFESSCANCHEEVLAKATYRWRIFKRDSKTAPENEDLDFEMKTSTGIGISMLSIRPRRLEAGGIYRLLLELSSGVQTGSANVELLMNLPPYNGECTTTPETGLAALHLFNLTCTGWLDEANHLNRSSVDTDEGLTYQFVQLVGNEKSLLYWGKSNSPAMELNLGLEDQNYTTILVARIIDSYNGFVETNSTVTVTASMEKEAGLSDLKNLSLELDSYAVKVEQYLSSGDVRKSSRLIESTASVVNTLKLPEQLCSLSDPSLWTGDLPLDLRYDEVVKWDELWDEFLEPKNTKLQDLLTREIEAYTSNFTSTIKNATGFDSLSAVYYVSSALRTLLMVPDRVSADAVKMTVNTTETMSRSLGYLVSTSMSAVIVGEVIQSVFNTIDSTIGATLPQVSKLGYEVNIANAHKKLEISRQYDESGARDREYADLHDDERAFFLEQSQRRQQHEAMKKRQLAEEVLGTIQLAADQALDTAARFLVTGQTAWEFQNSKVSGSVEKVNVGMLADRGIQREDVSFTVRRPASFDGRRPSSPNDIRDGQLQVKVKIFHKNPFVWDVDASSAHITSPAVEIKVSWNRSLDDFSDLQLKQAISVPNPTPVETITIVPKYNPLAYDKFVYRRIELASTDDSIVLYLSSHTKYDVYFRSGDFPTSSDFDYKVTVAPDDGDSEDGQLKAICPGGSLPSAGTIYVALSVQNSSEQTGRQKRSIVCKVQDPDNDELVRNDERCWTLGVTVTGCKLWHPKENRWDSWACALADSTSEGETVCICEKSIESPVTLATSFAVPMNKIDFATVFTKIDLLNNASVFATILTVLGVYLLLVLWARNKDRSDMLKWGVTPLIDNSPHGRYLYIVTVYTGMRNGAGTHSRVGFAISGEDEETGNRLLYDGFRKEMPRLSVMNFLMAVSEPLRHPLFVRIWHDNSGVGDTASWYLHKMVIEDIQQERRYMFPCDQWLAVDREDGKIERILPVSGNDNLIAFDNVFTSNLRMNVTDNHLWLSVLMRPQRSHFTRVQRLSCCLSLLFLIMITSAMFYQREKNIVRPTMVNLGFFLRFSLQEVYVSVISILIVTPVNLLIVGLFKKSRPRSSSMDSMKNCGNCTSCHCKVNCGSFLPRRESEERENLEKSTIVTGYRNGKGKMLPYYFIYIGWVILLVSVALPAFFLFLFSQEWGKTHSEEWLTAFILSFTESLLVMDPIKVVCLAVFLTIFVRKPDVDIDTELDDKDLKSKYRNSVSNTNIPASQRLNLGPPEDGVISESRKSRRKETKAMQIMREVVVCVIVLLVIFTLGYSNRDPRSFAIRDNIYNMMVRRQFDKRPGMVNVVTKGDFFSWMEETAFPALFYEQYYSDVIDQRSDSGAKRTMRRSAEVRRPQYP